MCTRQSRKVTWDMINTLFLTIVAVEFICQCFPLALANICPWPQVPFFQISVKKSELKTTHNTFWDCRVHFFRQPFSKQLYLNAILRLVNDKLFLFLLVYKTMKKRPRQCSKKTCGDGTLFSCKKHFCCIAVEFAYSQRRETLLVLFNQQGRRDVS